MTSSNATPSRPLRIGIVVGEASGDLLAASMIRELRQRHPDAQIAGIGGPLMASEGFDAWWDCSELSVMGIAEVLKHLRRLLKLRRAVLDRLVAWAPDVVVGVDAPDFNLGLERSLKDLGIPTAHYVSPSIWAWREGRAKKLKRSADLVLCLFPIEPPIYARYQASAAFVGHPLTDDFPLDPGPSDRDAALARLGLPGGEQRYLAVLPGSRMSEIRTLAPAFLVAAARFLTTHPGYRVIVPEANAHTAAAFRAVLDGPIPTGEGWPEVTQEEWAGLRAATTLASGDKISHAAMMAADLVLLASGTAALECALAKRPMVVAYRVAPLTYFIAKTIGLVKVDRYSLPNILAGRPIVPELMQHDCTPDKILHQLDDLASNQSRADAMRSAFTEIHRSLGTRPAAAAADAVLGLIPGL